MQDLLITLIAVVPVIMALLAAVAPPKAAWIRPALLPAVPSLEVAAQPLPVKPSETDPPVEGAPPRPRARDGSGAPTPWPAH